jgi:hypothetical protein
MPASARRSTRGIRYSRRLRLKQTMPVLCRLSVYSCDNLSGIAVAIPFRQDTILACD